MSRVDLVTRGDRAVGNSREGAEGHSREIADGRSSEPDTAYREENVSHDVKQGGDGTRVSKQGDRFIAECGKSGEASE